MSRRIRERIDEKLAAETGTVYKDPGGRINVALCYPNYYSLGMSNLGFQGVYGMLNAMNGVVCERVFLPDSDDMREYGRSGSRLMSMESKRPLAEFHAVAFSVSYENDYPAIPAMLDLAGIPRRASDRNESHPLVILGGICAAYNPEPLANFFDVVFVGEAEESIHLFIEMLEKHDDEGRAALLARLARIEGVYIPSLYREAYGSDGAFLSKIPAGGAPAIVKRGHAADLDETRLSTVVSTGNTEFSRMCLIEAMRGCPWSCRFCVVSYVYRPVRYRSREVLEGMITESAGRFPKVGLVGPSVSDYRWIEEIIKREGVKFSVSSLRAWGRSVPLIKALAERGQKSLSIAIEAGTERLRGVIRKRITEADILETAGLILDEGIAQLRLYFMIGLPTETVEDIEAIPALVKKIRELNKSGSIVVSVNPLVPKPFTPFQWLAMDSENELKKKLDNIKKLLKGVPSVSVVNDSLKRVCQEAFLARGDRRVSYAIEAIAAGGDWRKAARGAGCDPESYIHQARSFDAPLPWEFIDIGTPKDRLEAECRKALGGE
ncbi:MAG: radical SAM protein [Nitrospirae bacterium]|nr:radical SAM protein [Nitrospirota bacterium]